jgi:hypothetical protein
MKRMMPNPQRKVRENIKIVIDQNYKFYLEFCKLYEANVTLNAHLTSLLKEKNTLKNEIQKLEVK